MIAFFQTPRWYLLFSGLYHLLFAVTNNIILINDLIAGAICIFSSFTTYSPSKSYLHDRRRDFLQNSSLVILAESGPFASSSKNYEYKNPVCARIQGPIMLLRKTEADPEYPSVYRYRDIPLKVSGLSRSGRRHSVPLHTELSVRFPKLSWQRN